MKEIRMFGAVKSIDKPILAWLYGIAALGLVSLFISLGSYIGGLVIWGGLMVLPSDVMQFLMFTIDPLFVDLLIFIFPGLLLCLWVFLAERRSIKGLGFFKEKAWWELAKGWLIGSLMMVTVVGLQVLTGSISLHQVTFSGENILSFLLIIPFWLIQSGVEELLTRGWLFPVLSKHTHIWIGMGASSLLFAILHLQNPSINWISLLNIALFGFFACLYVLKTDNIWGISAIHAAWNCIQGSFFGLPVSGITIAYAPMNFTIEQVPEYLSGGTFGPEGSLLSSLVLLVGILYLAWHLYQKKQSQV